MSYSQLMHGLKAAGIEIDRKMLADIAVKDAGGFTLLAEQAKAALGAAKPRPSGRFVVSALAVAGGDSVAPIWRHSRV